ncbi:hypothetical protein N9235_00725 [Gammaproteobacteria bacterium]|nr:hypothetical protein [Gammaproteobacteria bacterium]
MTKKPTGKPTEERTRKGKSLKLRSGKPEDKIFSRGFVIGGVGRSAPKASSNSEDEKPASGSKTYKVPYEAILEGKYQDMFKVPVSTEACRTFPDLANRLEKAIRTGVRDLPVENAAAGLQFFEEDEED